MLSIITKKSPTLASASGEIFEFDAVISTDFDISVSKTAYPIEVGANVTDHTIVNPKRYSITGVVSNTPIKTTAIGIAAGMTAGLSGSGVVALSAGYLAGSRETRAASALETLVRLTENRTVFDVDSGDIQLKNMIITELSRRQDASNENALVFVAQLEELPTLYTTLTNQQPVIGILGSGDPSRTQAAATASLGEKAGRALSSTYKTAVGRLLK